MENKVDKRKQKPTSEIKNKRSQGLRNFWDSESGIEGRKTSSRNAKKRWENRNANLVVTNVVSGETSLINGSISEFCKEKKINYRAFFLLTQGKVKISNGWFLGTEKPTYIDRKGEKRKPQTNETKLKKAMNFTGGNAFKFLNLKTREITEFHNRGDFAKIHNFKFSAVNNVAKGCGAQVGEFILYKDEYLTKPIICNKCVFACILDAYDELGVNPVKVLMCCEKEQKETNGLSFRFASSEEASNGSLKYGISFYETNLKNSIKAHHDLMYYGNQIMNPKRKREVYSGIYIITCLQSGKEYYGSSVDIQKRWWNHKKDLEKNVHDNFHLQKAWNLYGSKTFEFSLYISLPNILEQDLKREEQKILDEKFSINSGSNLYNISKIADGVDGSLAKIPILQINAETNEIIKEWPSAADAYRFLGMEGGIYEVCKGNRITAGGFKWTYKDEEKASSYPEKEGTWGGHGKRKVIQLDVIMREPVATFESLEAAGKANNMAYNRVLSTCMGRKKSANGNLFVYEEDYQKLRDENNNLDGEECLVCHLKLKTLHQLSLHLRSVHKTNSEEYSIKFFHNGIRPPCKVEYCDELPRYSTYQFRNYCKSHSHIAESEGGKIGGKVSKK